MYHFFVREEQIGDDLIFIEGQDVNHIRNVLRMREGEQICVSSREGGKEFRAEITALESGRVTARILWTVEPEAELPSRLVLFQGLPKGDKMELIIQKAVELGAARIVPVSCARSVVKLDEKKAASKVRRWQAVCESAAKQSGRRLIPEVGEVTSFAGALREAAGLDVCLIPYERAEDMAHTRQIIESIRPGQSVGILIGPEGGFEPEEVQEAAAAGAKPITLGKRILRTETAGMTVLSVLMFHLEQREDNTETEVNDERLS